MNVIREDNLKYGKRELLFGVGINDSDYTTQKNVKENGKSRRVWQCPFHSTWVSIMRRCYSEVYQNKQPTYKGCIVSEEWYKFSSFKTWMETQDWEGKALDKDLLVEGNRVYSKDTCVFVSQNVNNFTLINKSANKKGLPLGVSMNYNNFKARLSVDNIRVSLGTHKTPMAAHRAWQLAKRDRALQLKAEQTDRRVIGGLQRIIDKLQHDYDNNLETKTL